jgi:hypothetical protein
MTAVEGGSSVKTDTIEDFSIDGDSVTFAIRSDEWREEWREYIGYCQPLPYSVHAARVEVVRVNEPWETVGGYDGTVDCGDIGDGDPGALLRLKNPSGLAIHPGIQFMNWEGNDLPISKDEAIQRLENAGMTVKVTENPHDATLPDPEYKTQHAKADFGTWEYETGDTVSGTVHFTGEPNGSSQVKLQLRGKNGAVIEETTDRVSFSSDGTGRTTLQVGPVTAGTEKLAIVTPDHEVPISLGVTGSSLSPKRVESVSLERSSYSPGNRIRVTVRVSADRGVMVPVDAWALNSNGSMELNQSEDFPRTDISVGADGTGQSTIDLGKSTQEWDTIKVKAPANSKSVSIPWVDTSNGSGDSGGGSTGDSGGGSGSGGSGDGDTSNGSGSGSDGPADGGGTDSDENTAIVALGGLAALAGAAYYWSER